MRVSYEGEPATGRVYREGDYWRWLIRRVDGREYVDGANYFTREEAIEGLRDALGPQGEKIAAAEAARVAAREAWAAIRRR